MLILIPEKIDMYVAQLLKLSAIPFNSLALEGIL